MIELFQAKGKTLRVLSAAVFAAAFLGPWGTILGDTVLGYDILRTSISFTVQSLFNGLIHYWGTWGIYYCFAWMVFGLHWIVNFGRAFGKNGVWRKRWLNLPLIFSIGFLTLDAAPRILFDSFNRFFWPRLYWGYWLLLLSIGFGAFMEIGDYLITLRTRRDKKQAL